MSADYSERLIATGRVVLALSLLTVWLEHPGFATLARISYQMLVVYAGYAVLLAVAAWRSNLPLGRIRLVTHVVDLGVFFFMYLSENPMASSFFIFFVFSMLTAPLRWQWRGTLWTALAVLALSISANVYQVFIARTSDFSKNRFMIRGVLVVAVSGLLAYLGAYELRLRKEISRLASWSWRGPEEPHAMVRTVLEEAAGVLDVPRVLLAWEEPEEPWVHLALVSRDEFRWTREAPGSYTPLVAERLASTDFVCDDAAGPDATVLHTSTGGLQRWNGRPLCDGLRSRFGIRAVLAVRLDAQSLEGWLFWLDRTGMTSDDLSLAQIVARQVGARMDRAHLVEQRQRAVAAEDRIHLARDLHDGLLQSLTAIGLKLEAARTGLDEGSDAVQKQMAAVQALVAAEQRHLRVFIRRLKPSQGLEPDPTFVDRLELLAQRLQLEWGISVDLRLANSNRPVSSALSDEIYYIVSEAFVNAARHSGASVVRVALEIGETQVEITVTDDGHGFPFRGRYDGAALRARAIGPVTLRERVASLGGTLTIDSSDSGASVEIALPSATSGGPRGD